MMSKKNVFNFLAKAAQDQKLKNQLESTSTPEEVVGVGNRAGYEFSSQHVDEALADLKRQPGFFGVLAEAVIELFSPDHDDYPASGVQPFSGDPNPDR